MRKRVLSMFLILGMVLVMLPVLQWPVAAASAETAGLRFPSDVESYEAECTVCKKTVTWEPYNGENYSDDCPLTASSTSAHFHLYLTRDQVYEAGKYFLVAYRNVCFNLNGYDITGSAGSSSAFAGARKMNFIDTYGGSVITGCRNVANSGAAINANSVNADYHLYGGTWTVAASDTLSPVIRLSTKGGIISLHDGAIINAGGRTGSAVTLAGSITSAGKVQSAVFNVYGGEIIGDIIAGVPGENTAGCAVLNLLGGTVDGDVYIDNGATFTDGGGTITGSVTAAPGMEIALSGKTEIRGGLVPADGVAIADSNGKMVVYATADAAVAAYSTGNGFANGSVLVVGAAGQTITLSGDAYVDAAGNDVTVNGSGKLYGIDSGNDDYTSCAQWALGENVVPQADVFHPVNGNRYLALQEDNTLSYHRIKLAITQVVLRTKGEPGMYYKAKIQCDPVLAELVTGFGVALSVDSMPGADFAEKADVKYTAFDRDDFASLYQNGQHHRKKYAQCQTECICKSVFEPAAGWQVGHADG